MASSPRRAGSPCWRSDCRPKGTSTGRERQRERRDDRRWVAAVAACTGTAQAGRGHRGARRERWPARPAGGADPRQSDEDRRPVAKQSGAQVLLVGMRLPPNYGPRYTNDFMRMYPRNRDRRARRARAVPASIRGTEAGADAGGRAASRPRKRSPHCSTRCGRSSRRLLRKR